MSNIAAILGATHRRSVGGAPAYGAEVIRVNPAYTNPGSATVNYATSATVSSGSILILVIMGETGTVSGVTDAAGNTYTVDSTQSRSGVRMTLVSGIITSTLSSGQNVTVTMTTTGSDVRSCLGFTITNASARDATAVATVNNFVTAANVTTTPTASPTFIVCVVGGASNFAPNITTTYGTLQSTFNFAGNGAYSSIYYAAVPTITATQIGVVVSSAFNATVQAKFYK